MKKLRTNGYSSIVFIANIASPEIKLINEIEGFCKKEGIELIKIVLESHDANMQEIHPNNLIYLGSQDPSVLGFELSVNGCRSKVFQVKGEKESVAFTRYYLNGIDKFKFTLRQACRDLTDPLFIINNQLGSLFRISERYAKANGVGCIIYNRWYKPNTYTFTSLPFSGCASPTFKKKLSNHMLPYSPRYRGDAVPLNETGFCLVLLGSDDIGFRNIEQWKGCVFGDITAIEESIIYDLAKCNCKVIVRPHPHNKKSLEAWLENTDFIDGSSFDMDELIEASQHILTTQTSVAYRALEVFKKEIGVIGCFDNISSGFVRIYDLLTLRDYLACSPRIVDSELALSRFLNSSVYVTDGESSSLAQMTNYTPRRVCTGKSVNKLSKLHMYFVKIKALCFRLYKKCG